MSAGMSPAPSGIDAVPLSAVSSPTSSPLRPPQWQLVDPRQDQADVLLLYMRDMTLHVFFGFWTHEALLDTHTVLDHAWRNLLAPADRRSLGPAIFKAESPAQAQLAISAPRYGREDQLRQRVEPAAPPVARFDPAASMSS